ncbi:pilus assembly FimT family protein [Yersinia nurmii]|nr:prepilin-type N-terminal cleavage/methylation domain-containing protein [Yersinia nurmii]
MSMQIAENKARFYGFTLLEIMLVIFILSSMSVIAIFSINNDKENTITEAEYLYNTINRIKKIGGYEQTVYIIKINLNGWAIEKLCLKECRGDNKITKGKFWPDKHWEQVYYGRKALKRDFGNSVLDLKVVLTGYDEWEDADSDHRFFYFILYPLLPKSSLSISLHDKYGVNVIDYNNDSLNIRRI